MSFHDRIFGKLEEGSAMSDGYNGGPYQKQFTRGPKAGKLMVIPRGADWTYNSIHVQDDDTEVGGTGPEQGNVGQFESEDVAVDKRLDEAIRALNELV